MQPQHLLSRAEQGGKVCPLVNGHAALGEDDPGRALDEFLGAAHSECRVIGDGPLGPVELLTDSAGSFRPASALSANRGPVGVICPVQRSMT